MNGKSDKRKVLLLYPMLGNTFWFGVYEPLVMEIFSAIAKEEGCDVELIDLRFDRGGLKRLARRGYKPDMIGTTTHGFTEVTIVNELVRECKRRWPQTAVIVGGIPATVKPEFLDRDFIDCIVCGPGERLWRRFCRDGVELCRPARVVRDEEPALEFTFPTPDRTVTARYRRHYRTYIPNHTGRAFGRTGFTMLTQGCPFRCTFCLIWPANLGLYRKRRIEEVIADLRSIPESYVYFGDDNSFVDVRFASELAEAIRAAGIKKTYSSYCRVDHICDHPEVLRQWHSIGLRYLVVGIEAVNTKRLHDFNKRTVHEQNVRALKLLREIGILAIPHILVTPDMGHEDFEALYRFVEEQGFEYPTMVQLTPLPGTELYEEYRSAGRLLTEDLRFYNFMYNVVKPDRLTVEQYAKAYERLNLRIWSWRRFWKGPRGQLTFLAFAKWWFFVRAMVLKLRWGRRMMRRTEPAHAPAALGEPSLSAGSIAS